MRGPTMEGEMPVESEKLFIDKATLDNMGKKEVLEALQSIASLQFLQDLKLAGACWP